MKISDNVYFYMGDDVDQTKVYRGMASSNMIVLTGPEQIIIDCGTLKGKHRKQVLAEMKKDQINLNDTRHIFLTHFHPDHIVGAKLILRKANCKLWMTKETESFLFSSEYQFLHHMNFPVFIQKEIFRLPKFLLKLFLRYLGYNFDYLNADYYFKSGEVIDINHFKIKVISTPGHCTGHTSFYLPEKKITICGDVFTLHNHIGTSINNSSSSYPASLADLETLSSLSADWLVPGHDQPIIGQENISNLLNKIKELTIKLPNNVLQRIERPQAIENITRSIYGEKNFGLQLNNKIIVYNILQYLEHQGLVGKTLNQREYLWHRN